MKTFLSLLIVAIIYSSAYGQLDPGIESGIFRLEKGTFDSHQLMIGRKLPPPEVEGTYYLSENWQEGSFVMKDGRKSARYPLRYDVENALLEIDWNGQIKVVGEEPLTLFMWKNSETDKTQTFINGQRFTYAGAALSGFLELIYSGSDTLLLKTEAYIKEPTYVEGLDMGKRSAEIHKREIFYVCRDAKLTEIKRRKDVLNAVEPSQRQAVRDFMKKSNVKPDSREGLSSLWQFYESEVQP